MSMIQELNMERRKLSNTIPFLFLSLFCVVNSCCGKSDIKLTQTKSTITVFPDTIDIKEEKGINSMVIRKGESVLEIKQTGDFFCNQQIYSKIFEYDDNIFTNVVYYLNDTIKVLYYNEIESFINDSIYDINKDGINDLILKYKSASSIQYTIFLFGLDGMVAEEKKIYNYYPLSNKEFTQLESCGLDVVFFQKSKWNNLQIDTLEQIYYDIEEKKSYSTSPLIIIDGGYVKDKKAKVISLGLDKCYSDALKEYDLFPTLLKPTQ